MYDDNTHITVKSLLFVEVSSTCWWRNVSTCFMSL